MGWYCCCSEITQQDVICVLKVVNIQQVTSWLRRWNSFCMPGVVSRKQHQTMKCVLLVLKSDKDLCVRLVHSMKLIYFAKAFSVLVLTSPPCQQNVVCRRPIFNKFGQWAHLHSVLHCIGIDMQFTICVSYLHDDLVLYTVGSARTTTSKGGQTVKPW